MPMRPPVHHPQHGSPAQIRQRYERDRGTSDQRGYDRAWRRFRLGVLQTAPLCADCHKRGNLTAATEVHHIVKLRDRPDLKLDPANVMPLCRPCHSSRTANGE